MTQPHGQVEHAAPSEPSSARMGGPLGYQLGTPTFARELAMQQADLALWRAQSGRLERIPVHSTPRGWSAQPGRKLSVAGLAVTRTLSIVPRGPEVGWTLTHMVSGHGLGVYFPTAVLAARFAHHLRAADWTTARSREHIAAMCTAIEKGPQALNIADEVWTVEHFARRAKV